MLSKVLPPAPCCLTNDLERIQTCILVAVTELYLCSAYISVKLPLYEDKIWRGIETKNKTRFDGVSEGGNGQLVLL